MEHRRLVERLQWPLPGGLKRTGSIQNCQPTVYLCHNNAALRFHGAIVDPDVIYQAGPKGAGTHVLAAAGV
jgi:hypothetical protein